MKRAAAKPVPEPVRELLCSIAYAWRPTPIVLGDVEQLQLSSVDLSEHVQRLHLEAQRLVVSVSVPRSGEKLDALMPFDFSAKFSGTLQGGAKFQGDMISSIGRKGGFSRDAGMHDSMTIEATEWAVVDGEAPSVWVGQLEGALEVKFCGNLVAERRAPGALSGGQRCHLRLSGAYTYYLIQCRKEKAWHLVIDTSGAGAPDPELLGRDFLVLQFVFGRQLTLDVLWGLDEERRTRACIPGCTMRQHLEDGCFPPVPINRNNDEWVDESWTTVFFERISAAWRERPVLHQGFWTALEMYIDAMRDHLDGDYMRLQVALEAFAYCLLQHEGAESATSDVRNKQSWKKWVKENEAVIRAHAVEGREEALYQKVIAAHRLSSGRVVPSAFAKYGVTLTEDMTAELKGRDDVVHQGLMSPEGYEVPRDLRRVALVRTMLIALVAKAVGYAGAINGWEVGPSGYPIEPRDWWVVDDDDRDRAQRTFIAAIPVGA